jgi:hypothetical protein
MAKSTKFSKENQPKERKARGKSERTKLLEAFKREGRTEEGFYQVMVEQAFTSEDNFARGEVFKRLYPVAKATLPPCEFKFNAKGTAAQKANDILSAISTGDLPADVGLSLITAMASVIKIEEVTELEERIKALEEVTNEQI